VTGKWAHTLIETNLIGLKDNKPQEIQSIYQAVVPTWLKELNLDFSRGETEDLIAVTTEIAELIYRASGACKVNPIRNSNGQIPVDVEKYPPSTFTKELLKLSSFRKKTALDVLATRQNVQLTPLSLTWMLSKALSWGDFTPPEKYSKTLQVEYAFGTEDNNRVPLNAETSFLGYIDWIIQTDEGLGVLDHKTSTDIPKKHEVKHNPQLNLYAYVVWVLLGEFPKYIGINHLQSKKMILVETDKEIVTSTIKYFKSLYEGIQFETSMKHHPSDFNTPCLSKDYRSGKITKTCPYLKDCWPKYLANLTD
jgi:hypothetical protein